MEAARQRPGLAEKGEAQGFIVAEKAAAAALLVAAGAVVLLYEQLGLLRSIGVLVAAPTAILLAYYVSSPRAPDRWYRASLSLAGFAAGLVFLGLADPRTALAALLVAIGAAGLVGAMYRRR